ncbi:MAG TPA: efflux RND transporter permease subunit [Pseudobdellovibrionaceae bacterium]|nr:efflux RND transporter permease subunit [Pseudobdellovibrionaceae bacterium]
MLEYFLRKSVVTICLNLAILILGIFAFPRIAREFIPAIDIPAVAVVYPTTVHSLDTVRKELLEPAEQKLLQTGVIDRIESFYENGHAVLLLFFDWSLKPEECIQRARQTLSSFKPPAGMLNPLFILHRPTMSPIFRMGFFGDNPTKISKTLKVLSQDLERIPGVAQIRILGSSEKKTVLSYRLEDLAKYQIQPKTLLQEIVQKWGFRALLVDSVGTNNISVNIQNADQLLDLGIPNTQKQFIPIRFFTTKISQSPPAEVLNQNGQPTMILEVIKAPGADAVSLTEQIQKHIQEFSDQNKDTQSTIIYNEAEKIVDSQAGVYSNFLSGIVLNSIVLMIFLGSFAGVVVEPL